MNDRADAMRGNGRLLAWSALVGASALLIIAVKLIYDVPDDVRYRYSTVLFAVVVSALQLAIVLKIAGPGEPRDTFALRRPSWSLRRVALVGALIVIGTLVLVAFRSCSRARLRATARRLIPIERSHLSSTRSCSSSSRRSSRS